MHRRPLALIFPLACLLTTAGAAPARPLHIVAYGDSAIAGWLVARKDAYQAQLQALLRKQGYDVAVTNAGLNGGTLLDALLHFDEAIAPGTDIAIIEFGTNDLRQRASLKAARSRLTDIFRALRARKIEVLVIGLGSPKLDDVARAEDVAYAQWDLPPRKFRARDNAHYNPQGYSIVVARMLPLVEALIARAADH